MHQEGPVRDRLHLHPRERAHGGGDTLDVALVLGRSIDPSEAPSSPIAVATRPNAPGSLTKRTRRIALNEAETCAIPAQYPRPIRKPAIGASRPGEVAGRRLSCMQPRRLVSTPRHPECRTPTNAGVSTNPYSLPV